MKTLHTIDYSDAKRILDLIVNKALQMQKAAVIAVADSHGELMAFARMDGAPVSSIRIAANKAWTAARERKPTQDIGDKVRHPEKATILPTMAIPDSLGGAAAFRSVRMVKLLARLASADCQQTRTLAWRPWVSN